MKTLSSILIGALAVAWPAETHAQKTPAQTLARSSTGQVLEGEWSGHILVGADTAQLKVWFSRDAGTMGPLVGRWMTTTRGEREQGFYALVSSGGQRVVIGGERDGHWLEGTMTGSSLISGTYENGQGRRGTFVLRRVEGSIRNP